MPRNMSREKTVTRRVGWNFLKPGDILQAVEKAQGLKKGEKVKRICLIRVISCRHEPLNKITAADCILEGFPEMSPREFVNMFCAANKWHPSKDVNRIEFEYI
ncbi:MAG: hypothetical protein P8012_00075 [Desulfobacterales bacterium]